MARIEEIEAFLDRFHVQRETAGLVHVSDTGLKMAVRYDWSIALREEMIAALCAEDFVSGPHVWEDSRFRLRYLFRGRVHRQEVLMLLSLGKPAGPGICWGMATPGHGNGLFRSHQPVSVSLEEYYE